MNNKSNDHIKQAQNATPLTLANQLQSIILNEINRLLEEKWESMNENYERLSGLCKAQEIEFNKYTGGCSVFEKSVSEAICNNIEHELEILSHSIDEFAPAIVSAQ